MFDCLVIGAGPAGLSLAAALSATGLQVGGLTPGDPADRWPNTFGIWADELEPLGFTAMLAHRWSDCSVYTAAGELPLARVYGLLDNWRLQHQLLERCSQGGVRWQRGAATGIEQLPTHSRVTTRAGDHLQARLVIDASGHRPALLQRPASSQVAFQTAYGIVGTFSLPPVRSGQMVLMDYRSDHLTSAEKAGPPTFLYAMDLGDGAFFVEETSLAHRPALTISFLKERLHRRLAARGIQVTETDHVEQCHFPMNLPLPFLDQPLLGFGGAASMVHPASGYQVGAALSRAPEVARVVAQTLDSASAGPAATAQAGWQALWPPDRLRNRALYLFGLEGLLRCDEARLHDFFTTFFRLPPPLWSGYLSDRLTTAQLLRTMLQIFSRTSSRVRRTLMANAAAQAPQLWQALALRRAPGQHSSPKGLP